jgi:NAD(P)-dependent dehydrogenase (short-subunit alcohol dehydrogenase family)
LRQVFTRLPIARGGCPTPHPRLPILTSYSKFAVRSLNQGAALELGKYGITANVYCPGPVLTDMWQAIDKDFESLEGMAAGGITQKV